MVRCRCAGVSDACNVQPSACAAIAITGGGSLEDKLTLCFRAFDLNGDGMKAAGPALAHTCLTPVSQEAWLPLSWPTSSRQHVRL